MRRSRSVFYHVTLFVLAQLAWLSLLGLWIYWYVTNYLILSEVGDNIPPHVASEGRNILALVGGLFLLALVSAAMSLLFHRLNIQFNLTRMYDNFIANVTHELKSPLASIQLYLETMHLHDLPREKQQEFLSTMLRDTKRLNNLISTILEIPVLEQQKVTYSYEILDVEPLFRSLVLESMDQFNLTEEMVTFEGTASCQCVIDRNAMKIVIDNLFDNSKKYSIHDPKIHIQIQNNSGTLLITYSDQGIGISPNDQKKIFEKFFRIYNRNVPNVKGTGLGLYRVRQIIRYHKGKISVSSGGRNQGTTFSIELPVYQESNRRNFRDLLRKAQRRQVQRESEQNDE